MLCIEQGVCSIQSRGYALYRAGGMLCTEHVLTLYRAWNMLYTERGYALYRAGGMLYTEHVLALYRAGNML